MKADETGHLYPVESNIYYSANDYFYEAKGRYSLFFSCNTWINSGLKVIGQKAALWTAVQQGIFYHYKE